MNTKKIALLGLVIVVGVGLFLLSDKRSKQTDTAVLEQGWAVFEAYLAAAREHDLQKVADLSYQLSDTCKDETRQEECNALMDNVAFFGQSFVKESMWLFGRDRKQIILTGDYVENVEGDVPSITRPIIYLVRDGDTIKLLSFNPFQGTFHFRSEDTATSTIAERLRKAVADSDRDALPDMTENCEDNTADTTCIKTNPRKKDSDGDGWWDSIEALFYRTESSDEAEE